jgi:hypothetical protein
MNHSSQTFDGYASRLCRLMGGKALPFRNTVDVCFEAAPHRRPARQSFVGSGYSLSERRSLAAQLAAKPRFSIPEFMLSSEAIKRV